MTTVSLSPKRIVTSQNQHITPTSAAFLNSIKTLHVSAKGRSETKDRG
jgi:hypothetical protein